MKFTITDSALMANSPYHVEIKKDKLFPNHIKFEISTPGDGCLFSGYFKLDELESLFKRCLLTINAIKWINYVEKEMEKQKNE